jgi:hypothetical protein
MVGVAVCLSRSLMRAGIHAAGAGKRQRDRREDCDCAFHAFSEYTQAA